MKPTLCFALLAAPILGLACFASTAEASDTSAPPTEVLKFDHAKVDAMLAAKGGPLVDNSVFKVQVSRRVVPGFVEIHTHETDVFYILQGAATIVTGGTAVGEKPAGPGQFHAQSIVGGTERHLAKGDVIVIPHGIPHWVTKIEQGPFLYFVVKAMQ